MEILLILALAALAGAVRKSVRAHAPESPGLTPRIAQATPVGDSGTDHPRESGESVLGPFERPALWRDRRRDRVLPASEVEHWLLRDMAHAAASRTGRTAEHVLADCGAYEVVRGRLRARSLTRREARLIRQRIERQEGVQLSDVVPKRQGGEHALADRESDNEEREREQPF